MMLVYFVYGLAFFSLGLAILLRYDRHSVHRIAQSLWFLAAFGFLHGLKEWLDLWCLLQQPVADLRGIAALLLLASFLLLFEFGRRIFLESQRSLARAGLVRRLLGAWLYVPMLLLFVALAVGSAQPWRDIAIVARYVPGFFGALLAAFGMHLYYRNCVDSADAAGADGPHGLFWHMAALSLAGYGVFAGLFTERADWYPASVLNTTLVYQLLGVPVQILRALCALGVAVSVGHLLKVFQVEHEYQLRSEIERRKAAMDLYGETRAFLDALLGATGQCVVKLNSHGEIDYANDRALQTLLCPREMLLGHSFYRTFQHSLADGSARQEDPWSAYLAGPSVPAAELARDCFWRKNGSWVESSYRATVVQSAGQRRGLLIVFQDLSE